MASLRPDAGTQGLVPNYGRGPRPVATQAVRPGSAPPSEGPRYGGVGMTPPTEAPEGVDPGYDPNAPGTSPIGVFVPGQPNRSDPQNFGPRGIGPVTVAPRPPIGPPLPPGPPGGGGGSQPPRGPDMGALQGLGNAQMNASSGDMLGATPFWQSPALMAAGQRVGADSITGDPAVQAALADYQANVLPGLQNQAALMGLGRSSSALGMQARAQASMLTPLYQDAMAREQHRQDRFYGASEEELGRRERSDVRGSEAQQNMIGQLLNLANMGQSRQQQGIQNLMQGGGLVRDIQQQGLDAQFQDYMRRQGLAEQAVGMPFGGLAGAGLGSVSRSSK